MRKNEKNYQKKKNSDNMQIYYIDAIIEMLHNMPEEQVKRAYRKVIKIWNK